MFLYGFIDKDGMFVSKSTGQRYQIKDCQDTLAIVSVGYVALEEDDVVVKMDSMPYPEVVSKIGVFAGAVTSKNTAALAFASSDLYVEEKEGSLLVQTFGEGKSYGPLCFSVEKEHSVGNSEDFDVLYIECEFTYDENVSISSVSKAIFLRK